MAREKQEAVYVPDGGWGWVIVACSFLIHMFVVGTLYALSVLYVAWLDAFQNGKGITSGIISMAVAVMFGIGPLPGSLSRRYGNRTVVMLGGIMMAVGFFISSFAVNVYFLIITVGIIAGVGAGCCYLPSVSLVAQYFTSKRSLAMGISASGLGVGAFFMAPLLNWLVESFGWRGTMMIVSGISLNMCVLASLMRPLELAPHCRNCQWVEESDWASENQDIMSMEFEVKKNTDSLEKKLEEKYNEICGPKRKSEEVRAFFCACGRPNQGMIRRLEVSPNMSPLNYFPSPSMIPMNYVTPMPRHLWKRVALDEDNIQLTKANTASLQMNSNGMIPPESSRCVCSFDPRSKLKIPLGGSLNDLGAGPINSMRRSLTVSHIPFSSKVVDDEESKIVFAISRTQNGGSAKIITNGSIAASATSMDEQADDDSSLHQENLSSEDGETDSQLVQKNNNKTSGRKSKLGRIMRSAETYIKLMHSSIFMVFCISNFLTNLSFLMPVLYMVDRALDAGIGKGEAAMLVSVYGTGNIFGKVFFGWLADRKLVDRLLYYIVCLSMCGTATCASPLCGSSETLHSLYAFTFGCFIGAYCTLFPLVTVDLVGMSVVEESFGMLLCFMGAATAFGTPVAGWIFDWTGSYSWAFLLHGAFILISALMLVPVLCRRSQCSKPK